MPDSPTTSAASSSKAIVKKRNAEVKLNPENRPIKLVKKPRIVLEEDDFTGDLEKIIVRDYFPEVPRLKAQQAYLDAVSNNDVEKIRELQMRFSSNFTKGAGNKTVRRFNLNGGRFDVDTDMEEVTINPEGLNEEDDTKTKAGIDIDQHTVQSFVDTYVSEDSKSFHDIMDYENKKHRAKFDWIYKAEERHNKEMIERGQPLVAEADQQLMLRKEPEDLRLNEVDNWAYKSRNTVLFDPEGAAPTLREFMEAVKNDATKIINKSGTRIDTNKLNWHDRPTASNQFAVPKVDITGKQSDARARVPGRFQPIETPNPSIGADETPITTWGQIDGTPFPLDGSNMTPLPANVPSYKLPEMTKREIVAHEMAEKLKRQNKVKKEFSKRLTDRLKDPHTRLATASRLSLMSPAATKFATTKLGIRSKGTGPSTKKTPLSIRLQPPSVRVTPRAGSIKTPLESSARTERRLEPIESVINENLLSVRKQKHQFH